MRTTKPPTAKIDGDFDFGDDNTSIFEHLKPCATTAAIVGAGIAAIAMGYCLSAL